MKNPCKACVKRVKSPDFYTYSTNSDTTESEDDVKASVCLTKKSKKKKRFGRKFVSAFRKLAPPSVVLKTKHRVYPNVNEAQYEVCHHCLHNQRDEALWLYYLQNGEIRI